jgi:CBS domain-containing protein
MKIAEIMTKDPACCTPNTNLGEVARMMVECDCGEIPVVKDEQSRSPIGVITDRDIVCRAIALGKNPLDLSVRDCMTSPAVTVSLDTDVEECCRIMQQRQIRRVPVVDKDGRCCGIVAQADLARHLPKQYAADVVQQVSRDQPFGTAAPTA